MENVNDRRGFLKGFGLLSAIAAGATTHHYANTGSVMAVRESASSVLPPPVVDYSHLAPLGKTTIVLSADNTPPPPPPPPQVTDSKFAISGNSYQPILMVNSSGMVGQNNVKMSVGKDDRLWIEVGGQWKRVALET